MTEKKYKIEISADTPGRYEITATVKDKFARTKSLGIPVSIFSPSSNKYKILKDNEQVANVSIVEFVKAVQSGAAQEDWGVGAQIVIPYTDPVSRTEVVDLPFNLGTFTAYGEGKVGLQAHYAVPYVDAPYSGPDLTQPNAYKTEIDGYISWKDSIAREWLNSYNAVSDFPVADGFLAGLPEDFVRAIIPTNHGSTSDTVVSSKFFLPGATNLYAQTGTIGDYTVYDTVGDGESAAWEYWRNRIGTPAPQSISTSVSERIVQGINHNDPNFIGLIIQMLPNKVYYSTAEEQFYSLAAFTPEGSYLTYFNDNEGRYVNYLISQYPQRGNLLPACVIG